MLSSQVLYCAFFLLVVVVCFKPERCKRLPDNHRFCVSEEEKAHQLAGRQCYLSAGQLLGELSYSDSKEVVDFVTALNISIDFWTMGRRDKDKWVWKDFIHDSTIEFGKEYVKWCEGQPVDNSTMPNADCMMVDTKDRCYKNFPCKRLRFYVCYNVEPDKDPNA